MNVCSTHLPHTWLPILCIFQPYTAGFVCKVLMCANYVSCRELTNFNSAVTLVLFSAHRTCQFWSVLVISLSYVSVQILHKSGHFCFAAWPKRPKDHSGCVHHDDIAALLQYNSPKHVVSSNHRVYSNNDSTSNSSTSHATACDYFTRSRT